MRALKLLTGHVIYNPAYTYKFQLKITIDAMHNMQIWAGTEWKSQKIESL